MDTAFTACMAPNNGSHAKLMGFGNTVMCINKICQTNSVVCSGTPAITLYVNYTVTKQTVGSNKLYFGQYERLHCDDI